MGNWKRRIEKERKLKEKFAHAKLLFDYHYHYSHGPKDNIEKESKKKNYKVYQSEFLVLEKQKH